jgi:hypothetical protein
MLKPGSAERAAVHLENAMGTPDEAEWSLLYTSGAYVSYFLIRIEPFTSAHIELQHGAFDHPSRLFSTVADPARLSDGLEAIPELFSQPDAFLNSNHFDLGARLNGEKVDDVALPKWARSAHHFVAVASAALEGAVVSANLGHWIDLVFGKFRHSPERHTLFLPYAYPEYDPPDDLSRARAQAWQQGIGLVPLDLFTDEHPARGPPPKFNFIPVRIGAPVLRIRKDVVSTVRHLIDCRAGGAVHESPNLGELWAVSRAHRLAIFGTGANLFVSVFNLRTGAIAFATHEAALVTCATVAGSYLLISGGSDGALRFWRLPDLELISVTTSHYEAVVTVAACLDNGLVASVDRDNNLLLQTISGSVVRCLLLDHEGTAPPWVLVYKSGLVVVVTARSGQSEIVVLDAKGEKIGSAVFKGKVVEVDKCIGLDTREFLLIGCAGGAVRLYEVVTLTWVTGLDLECDSPVFSRAKGGVGLVRVDGEMVVATLFDVPPLRFGI